MVTIMEMVMILFRDISSNYLKTTNFGQFYSDSTINLQW